MVVQKRCDPPCDDCSTAHKEYLRQQRLRRGLRRQDKRIDAQKTRERLIELRDVYLITAIEIGRRTQMSDVHIGRIINGKTRTVYTSKARQIFRLYNEVVTTEKTPRPHRNPNLVPADLTRLALRGLAAQGYSRVWIREQIGLDFNAIWRITMDTRHYKSRKLVQRSVQTRVVDLARRVGSSDGGNNCVRAKALARGWKPTMYCDELV